MKPSEGSIDKYGGSVWLHFSKRVDTVEEARAEFDVTGVTNALTYSRDGTYALVYADKVWTRDDRLDADVDLHGITSHGTKYYHMPKHEYIDRN